MTWPVEGHVSCAEHVSHPAAKSIWKIERLCRRRSSRWASKMQGYGGKVLRKRYCERQSPLALSSVDDARGLAKFFLNRRDSRRELTLKKTTPFDDSTQYIVELAVRWAKLGYFVAPGVWCGRKMGHVKKPRSATGEKEVR